MEKERDKQSIDDLFARKLGKMVLPPSADGFERLQKRIAQQAGTPVKVVIWHNPTVQRYMAVAACLLIICLFGWLYWPISSVPSGSSVAIHQSSHSRKKLQNFNRNATSEQVATVSTQEILEQKPLTLSKEHYKINNVSKPVTPTIVNHTALVGAQGPPTKGAPMLTETETITSVIPSLTGQLPENAVKSVPRAERVLVVTIEEPAVLAVDQQERSEPDEKPIVAVADKPAKDAKTGNLWQKVKQIRQGELLAKSDNAADDDQGLLSRAYTGLKHSIEKSKTTRQ